MKNLVFITAEMFCAASLLVQLYCVGVIRMHDVKLNFGGRNYLLNME